MWGRGQRNRVMKYGEGPGESVVHGPRASSLRHCVRLYVSDEIQQLDLNDTSLMDLLRDVHQCKQKCTF